MVRLAAVDMDGTLLNPMGEISEKNVRAIRSFQESGGEFVICTGRNYDAAKDIVTSSGIVCSYICLSGAAVYDQQGQQQTSIPLPAESVSQINSIFGRYHVSADFLTDQGNYSTMTRKEKMKDMYQFISGKPVINNLIPDSVKTMVTWKLENIHFITNANELLNKNIAIYKICGNGMLPTTVSKMKKDFLSLPHIAAASSFPTNIELTDITAQKGLALEIYAENLGIPMSEVMAIGDSDNDLSMISMDFGYTVAMGNAMDCIKQAAKYQTRSNREDGVAWALAQYT